MHYVSTRGYAEPTDLDEVLLGSTASDGGLYLPDSWPQIDPDPVLDPEQDFFSLWAKVMAPFAGKHTWKEQLPSWCQGGAFSHEDVTPLRQLADGTWLLELFHGPTFSFKDIAMHFLGRAMESLLRDRKERRTIVAATSGDTGVAAMAALADVDNCEIFVLFPDEGVSRMQRAQMSSFAGNRAHPLAVRGTFDDCQHLVKRAFLDKELQQRFQLGAVNSINWGRIMAQTGYYWNTCKKLWPGPVHFIVPTGNFGDVFAGWVARKMGAPIGNLVIATGENDILFRTWKHGIFRPEPVRRSCAPSIDIQIPSNFERFLFEVFERDSKPLIAAMNAASNDGQFQLDGAPLEFLRQEFQISRADHNQIVNTIRETDKHSNVIIDPHTAVAASASQQLNCQSWPGSTVILATAHPGKFPDVVREAIERPPPAPNALAKLPGASPMRVISSDTGELRRTIQTLSQF